jgi:hypothetical protein
LKFFVALSRHQKMPTRYVELSDPIYEEVTQRIRLTYPHACVVFVESVHNEFLEAQFEDLKRKLEEKRGPGIIKILSLFHGTTEKAVNNIIAEGFDPEYNKTSAYGIGTYFSAEAKTSSTYARDRKEELQYMFLANVIDGIRTTTAANQKTDTEKYDLSVSSTAALPTICCTPYRYGAIPRYLIGFHRFAT